MIIARRHAEWLAIAFFAVLVAVVFQQIYTSMTEQGIASGGPYDNAAAYPKAIAILIGVLLVFQAGLTVFGGRSAESGNTVSFREARRPAALVLVFAAYLYGLDTIGYHLATPLMVMAVMVLGGMRSPIPIAAYGVGVSLAIAYFFEAFLKIVLPGGVFALNIPW